MIDTLSKAIEAGQKAGATYVEARGEDGFIEFIQMDDGRINALTQRLERGVAIRALVDGAWGFVSTGDTSKLEQAVLDACSMAKAAAVTRREPIELAEIKSAEAKLSHKVERDPRNVSIEEKISYMSEMTKYIQNYDKRITAVTVKIRTSSGKKFLVTSDGTNIESSGTLVWVYPWVTGKEGTRLSAARHEDASTSEGWEFMERYATPEFIGQKAAERVKLQLDGVAPKAGSFPCVLAPRIVGVLVHEALGHLSEADLTVNSAFNGKLGEVVAADGVNMTDDGTINGMLGTGKYDDEGVVPTRVEIIKDSVLTGLLNNREFAQKLGHKPTGNARADGYLHPPIIRMRNTFFEPGDMNEDEIFEDIDFGYYCVDFRAGQTQMNASFQVGVQEVYEIINGEIGGPVTDLSISGIATDSLFKITGVSKEMGWESGRCGKGAQESFVASGGPKVRYDKGGITFGGRN